MKKTLKEKLNEWEDHYAPINFYCRLIDKLDFKDDIAWEIANIYDKYFYSKIKELKGFYDEFKQP